MIPLRSAHTNNTNTSCLTVGDSAACLAPYPALGQCVVASWCETRFGQRNWKGAQVVLPKYVPNLSLPPAPPTPPPRCAPFRSLAGAGLRV